MSSPDEPFHKQRSKIRAPSVASPPKHLVQKSPVILERWQELCFRAHLHVRAPSVRYHPSRQKLVVARVQKVFSTPVIVDKVVLEAWVFKDNGSVRSSATRNAAHAAVNVRRCSDFNVANGKSEPGQDFPDGSPLVEGFHGLRCAHTADGFVLETRQDIIEHGGFPDSIVVCKHKDICGGVLDALYHLYAFACFRYW